MAYLAVLDQVKKRLGIALEDVVDDALLTSFLALVTARAERECNRRFEYLETTQDFHADEMELVVDRFPIDETIEITFAVATNSVEGFVACASDYLIRQGCVISLPACLGTRAQQLRATYTGGYALPIAVDESGGLSVESVGPRLPDDLNQAAIQQVAWYYQNKNRLGLSNISQQGGSLTIADRDLLPDVKAVFERFERWVP